MSKMIQKTIKTDVCVMGAGSGGLSVAAGAVQMGASVVLIEADKMGGDCLNYGCVPSKALLAAAKMAHRCRTAGQFGVELADQEIKINFKKVMAHVQNVINTLSGNDSVERFNKLGVTVIQAEGKFVDANTVLAGDVMIKARRFVVATGSSPAVLFIPGLESVDQSLVYTNETIFSLTTQPEHLLIIGGGPIGCELAQAFLMLGTKVTIVEMYSVLPHDEQDLVALLKTQLLDQGLNLYEGVKIKEIQQENNQIVIIMTLKNGEEHRIMGSNLLIAAGRRANVNGLNLEAANIRYTPKGIAVDKGLRTSNKRVYAIGDVAGGYQFTHMANYHAGVVIRNLLFHLPSKVDYRAVPWVTYTEPELAHVGLSSAEALKQDPKATIIICDFSDNDRAQAEHKTVGKIKVSIGRRGKILGATLLGSEAGELLLPWILAIQQGQSIRSMTEVIVPYPTLSEMTKRVAGEYYKPTIFSPWMKRLVWLLQKF